MRSVGELDRLLVLELWTRDRTTMSGFCFRQMLGKLGRFCNVGRTCGRFGKPPIKVLMMRNSQIRIKFFNKINAISAFVP